jgi:hypothetical protein
VFLSEVAAAPHAAHRGTLLGDAEAGHLNDFCTQSEGCLMVLQNIDKLLTEFYDISENLQNTDQK